MTASRCGDVYSPAVIPWRARERGRSTRAVVVLPFVPVTWIVGYESCGSSSSVASCRIRARSGTIRDSLRALELGHRLLEPHPPARQPPSSASCAYDAGRARRAARASLSCSAATIVGGGLRPEPLVRELRRGRARVSRVQLAEPLRQAARAPPPRRSTPASGISTKPPGERRSRIVPGGLRRVAGDRSSWPRDAGHPSDPRRPSSRERRLVRGRARPP